VQKLVNAVKTLVGIFYLAGGPLIHLVLVTTNQAIYTSVADQAWPPYQTLWQQVVLPQLFWWVVLLMMFEATAGWLMLRAPRRPAIFGQVLGILFNLVLIPLWPMPIGLTNATMVALHTGLLVSYQRRPANS
jgi:hypothetical protein